MTAVGTLIGRAATLILIGSMLAFGIAVAGACDDSSADSPSAVDASSFEASSSDDAECCPPDPQPGCCMRYGGPKRGAVCGESCDGMPIPSDPGWTLTDAACPMWTNPNDHWHGGTRNPATSYCGEVGGDDPDASDRSDASHDADAGE